MATLKMTGLPAMRRQHLLAEFSGLKQVCPDGVFVSLTPGDPMLWSGVIFVRTGPYAPAILRFHISFPGTYPSLPPLVTFSTDIFHPLITPLTTYVHTTDVTDAGTVSANDDERLPPGGFSLRHGFPSWFGRASARSRQTSGQHAASVTGSPPPLPPRSASGAVGGSQQSTPTAQSKQTSSPELSDSPSASLFAQSQASRTAPPTSTYEVLLYLSSTFTSESVLDSIPLEAAGNPGAWHAWRSRQRGKGRGNSVVDVRGEVKKLEEGGSSSSSSSKGAVAATPNRKPPGEWNWEGVWEERVRRGVQASLSEAVLFGQGGGTQGDEVINFLSLDEGDVKGVKDNLLRTLGVEGEKGAAATAS